MAINSSLINVTDLDFDDISNNLKEYLKGQDSLKDFNFEGSTLSMLVDLLAYASHIGAVNTNIAASELFLDSAQIRKNVVSRAKDLGFTPSSEKAAVANIDLTISNVLNSDGSSPSITDMILPAGSVFSTVFDGVTYNFVLVSSKTPTQNGTSFQYNAIDIHQGTLITDTFVYDRQITNPKFVLSNQRSSRQAEIMTVSVNSGGITSTYTQSSSISSLTTTTKAYFVEENDDGFTNIYFGDGTLGVELKDGDVINVTYLVVDEVHANGAKTFSMVSSVNGFSDSSIVVNTAAAGGAEKEDLESIKFKASKSFSAQNRLVTLNDYKSKVEEFYPNADAIAVWGGEDNDPPQYGKVFIALKPLNSDYLTQEEKDVVIKNLNSLNMLTVRPQIVDAEIVKILVTTVFKYNERKTVLSIGELETLVRQSILDFDTNNLNTFDSIFRHSNLVKAIDEVDDSILSNVTNIRLRKALNVRLGLNKSQGYEVETGNALYHPHDEHNKTMGGITVTTGFYASGDSSNIQYFDDDGSGAVRRYYLSGSTRVYVDNSAGTVDYNTGKYVINTINITSTVNLDNTIDFTVIPNSNDVVATRGKLIDIDADNISVTGELDTISSGESSAGVGFTSTSNYTY